MRTNSRNPLIGFSLFAITILVLLSILGFTYSQAPVATSTVTPVQTQIGTSISTPTPTPSPTATPSYPSVMDIKNGLQGNFDDINNKLGQVILQTGVQQIVVNISGNLVSSFIWDFLLKPVFTLILSILGLVDLFGNIVLRIMKKRRDTKVLGKQAENHGDNSMENILTTIDFLFVGFFVIFLLSLIPITINSQIATSQSVNNADLEIISRKLDQIQSLIQSLSSQKPPMIQQPTNAIQLNPIIGIGFLLSLVGNVFLMLVYGSRKNNFAVTEIKLSKDGILGDLDGNLMTALLLSLILLLLPYPADTILLPFVLQYFIIAFFHVVQIYPNLRLKKIVTNHYSALVFLAEFGVWVSFFEVFQHYLMPFSDIAQGILNTSTHIQILKLPDYVIWEFSWGILPIFLGLLLAVPGWSRLRKLAHDSAIPNILESIELLTKQSEVLKKEKKMPGNKKTSK